MDNSPYGIALTGSDATGFASSCRRLAERQNDLVRRTLHSFKMLVDGRTLLLHQVACSLRGCDRGHMAAR